MEIRIEPGRTFDEINETINSIYPFLKIERLSSLNQTLDIMVNNEDLGAIYTPKKETTQNALITIDDNTTVADLINQLEEKLDLHVKVLRRLNDLWIVTSLTDNWTLKRQNLAGKQFNSSSY
ncbi:MAG: hypothetical protein ABIN89_20500 [Chitinophagaceae bacterium]